MSRLFVTPSSRACFLAVLFAAFSASAANFSVTNIDDRGPGSLRQALLDANALPGADTVSFSDGSGGTTNFFDDTPDTITLATSLPITDDMTVQGPGASRLTLSGDHVTRVLELGPAVDLGNSLQFDGTDDYVSTALPPLFSALSTNDFTVEGWIFPVNGFGRLFYAQVNPSNFATVLENNGNLLFYVKISNVTYSIFLPAPPSGQWTHVAARWTAAELKPELFLNGIRQEGEPTGASSFGLDGVMTIGARTDGAQAFGGEIDEFRVWSTARTEAEIQANLYRHISTPQSGLVRSYDFEQGVAGGDNAFLSTLVDRSGNAGHGTLINFGLSGETSNWVKSTLSHPFSATLEDLTIADGQTPETGSDSEQSGGGILVSAPGTLALKRCRLEGNTANLDGGALYHASSGDVALLDCQLSGNASIGGQGGAMCNDGPGHLTIGSSALFSNSGAAGGGALAHRGTGTVTVKNSTIALNTSNGTGGILNAFTGTVALTNVTVTANDGSGLTNLSTGSFTVDNSLVAGAPAGSREVKGAFTSSGTNFIGIDQSTGGIFAAAGDKTFATTGTTLADVLLPLADNGGNSPTCLLAPGSPAINAGSSSLASAAGLTLDQRGTGFARVNGLAVDIGALEVAATSQIVIVDYTGAVLNPGAVVDFGVALAGTDGAQQVFSISSQGNVALNVLSVSTLDGDAGDFSVSAPGLPTSVSSPNGSISFTVAFMPASPGMKQTTLRILSDDPTVGTFDLTLTGMARDFLPSHSVVLKKGSPAPGAGGAAGVPAAATLTTFGPPAIDDEGRLAFLVQWATTNPASKGTALVANGNALAVVGGDASAVTGVAGSKFKSFTDPVISNGRIACLATFSGVPAAQTGAVLSDLGGSLGLVAQAGSAATTDGARLKSFKNVAIVGDSVAFLAQLTTGTGTSPQTTAASDWGLWMKKGSDPLVLALRESQTVASLGQAIKTLVSFGAGSGSAGQGRGWLHAHSGETPGAAVVGLVTLMDGTQAILEVAYASPATPAVFSQSRLANAPGSPARAGATFAGFGLPSLLGPSFCTFLGTLTTDSALQITPANRRGIFYLNGAGTYAELARVGGNSGVNNQATFAALKDPVLAADGGMAFPATLQGGTAKGLAATTLWWQPPVGGLALLAQAGPVNGGIANDLPTGAQWKTFTSLAIAEHRGPIFTGTLVPGKGGATSATATGLWAADLRGTVRTLIRTGDTTLLAEKTLQSFSVLKAIVGSVGVSRSFNGSQQIVWLATFKEDKSQAIVVTEVP